MTLLSRCRLCAAAGTHWEAQMDVTMRLEPGAINYSAPSFHFWAEGHLEKFVLSGCEVRCLGEKRFSRVLKGALSRSRGWVALAKECLRRRWAPAWWRCALSPAMRAWPSAPGRPIG